MLISANTLVTLNEDNAMKQQFEELFKKLQEHKTDHKKWSTEIKRALCTELDELDLPKKGCIPWSKSSPSIPPELKWKTWEANFKPQSADQQASVLYEKRSNPEEVSHRAHFREHIFLQPQ